MNRLNLAAGIAGFVLFLLLAIPAPLLYSWSRDGFAAEVNVFGLGGNLWRGQATSATVGTVQLEALEWQLRPASLLLLRLSHRVRARTGSGELQAVISKSLLGSTLRISALNGSLPIEQTGSALGLPLMPFGGQLRLAVTRLHVRDGKPVLVSGAIQLDNLSFNFSSPHTLLGAYQVALATDKDIVRARITSEAGALEAQGSAESSPSGSYTLDMRLRPRATAPPNVVSLLQSLGQPDAEGWYRLRRDGNF